jgi:anthranilate synthase component 2
VATPININNTHYLFNGLADKIEVGRYHSWVIANKGLPASLNVTATDDNGLIMAIEHTTYDVCGVQFHPESVLTPNGETVIKNWLLK